MIEGSAMSEIGVMVVSEASRSMLSCRCCRAWARPGAGRARRPPSPPSVSPASISPASISPGAVRHGCEEQADLALDEIARRVLAR